MSQGEFFLSSQTSWAHNEEESEEGSNLLSLSFWDWWIHAVFTPNYKLNKQTKTLIKIYLRYRIFFRALKMLTCIWTCTANLQMNSVLYFQVFHHGVLFKKKKTSPETHSGNCWMPNSFWTLDKLLVKCFSPTSLSGPLLWLQFKARQWMAFSSILNYSSSLI